MPKAYSYIRMSTPEQMKGDSTRRQMKATEEYAKANDLELADIFHDRGVSAYKNKNAEMGELADFLSLARDGTIEPGSYLIVESLDRITRANVGEAMTLLYGIVQCGIVVVTLMDRQTYSKETVANNSIPMMIAALTLMRAHEESRTKSLRLSSVWKNKRDSARSGKKTKQRIPCWLQFSPSGDAIEPIPHRVSILREIFDLSRDGWGAYSIAKQLNDRGTPTWGRAKFWQESYVKKLLSNRAVLGEYQPYRLANDASGQRRHPDGKPIPNYYPIVIDQVTFADVQKAKAGRRASGKGRKGKIYSNLFTGLLRCMSCNSGIRYIDKGVPPKGGKYLRCSKAVLSRKCQSPAFRYDVIESHLLRLLSKINFDAVLNGPPWLKMTNELRVQQLEYSNRLDQLEAEIDNLAKSIAESGPSQAVRKMLDEREMAQQTTIRLKNAADSKLAEMTAASQSGHDDLIRQLQSADLHDDEKHALRRKIADEIRKTIRHIEIGKTSHMPFDFPDDHNLNYKDFNVFGDPNMSFELLIVYKDSSVQTFDILLGENVFFESNEKMNFFKERFNINKLT